METNKLTALLANLTGQLRTATKEEEQKLEEIQTSLALALRRQDPATIRNQNFIFEQSDLFRLEFQSSSRITKLNKILKKVEGEKTATNTQVFIRSVPVRTTQLSGGLTPAGYGTRASTLGPFLDLNGRDIFIDVVSVQQLLALYVQGQPQPALLFNMVATRPRVPAVAKNYRLAPNTIWINARLFDPASPEGYYLGLRIKGGSLDLSSNPTISDGKLTIPATATATCSLQLDQKTEFKTDPDSPYGLDARNAHVNLPPQFDFSFTGNSKNIISVGLASWKVYGDTDNFKFGGNQGCIFNPYLSCLAVPMQSNAGQFGVKECQSPFFTLSGKAPIKSSWWGIAAAKIDITAPPEADSNGSIIIECGSGLSAVWKGLEGGNISLPNPFILGEPGRINLNEIISAGAGTFQHFVGWQDEMNPFGTTMEWKFRNNALLLYNTLASGDELVGGLTDCQVKTDRPVKVNGEAVTAQSKYSNYHVWANKTKRQLALSDNNMLWDSKLPAEKIPKVKPYALALHNALFTVTPPNSIVVFALLSEDFRVMNQGKLYLSFGLFSYLPTLPDPYAANLGVLKRQFGDGRPGRTDGPVRDSVVWSWLVGLVKWDKQPEGHDKVGVSFHFAPLTQPLEIEKDYGGTNNTGEQLLAGGVPASGEFRNLTKVNIDTIAQASTQSPAGIVIGGAIQNKLQDFALLDVSSKANQMGVAFSQESNFLQRLVASRYNIRIVDENNAAVSPILVNGLDVVAEGRLAQAFTVPSIAWEPVFNLTPKAVAGDPPFGYNYYQSDGIATRMGNLSNKWVPLSPIPMAKYLRDTYEGQEDGRTYAIFNLPFGMVSISMLNNQSGQVKKPEVKLVNPAFENYITGGIQLELTAGSSPGGTGEGNLFDGYTAQLYNINNADGTNANASTLANSPTVIFNNEFFTNSSNLPGRPAVPLERIGLSGYGASTFSNWHNKDALFAQTSQALLNVTTGRTSHEVVQVKSMVYPWGIRVVRTITLFRLANGYVMRIDSGWQAESDGKFDFNYFEPIVDGSGNVTGKTPMPNPYEIHPGLVHGVFKVRNIQEIPKVFQQGTAHLQALTFDGDFELENITEGGSGNRVPSKGILGYVQLAPAGKPIDKNDFKGLLAYENNTIGGPVSCVIKIAGTAQRMQLNRVDVNNSVNASSSPAFVAATRGSVILPKEGSWSLVQHQRGTGEVTPLPEQLSVPLIRFGQWVPEQVVPPGAANELQRLAFPGDLLKAPDASTINFGFLQNLNSQKVLFLTPSFKPGIDSLLSKTPPLMADAYRLLNSKGIFPNTDNAETTFGTAMQMLTGVDDKDVPLGEIFKKVPSVTDVGKQVWEIMEVKAKEEAGKLVDQGYKLIKDKANEALNDIIKFDLPPFQYDLVDITGLKIFIEYKATGKSTGKNYVGKLDFDVNSFATDLADTWKGRMSNMAMVVNLGPMERLMTIKGNFNAQKGKETDFGSNGGDENYNLPRPEIEFSDAVKPVIQILEILAALSTGDYGEALKKGLKVAMSNNANLWEYKYEATKDIPLVRFPPTKALYDSPQTPLKLEASMAIGVYFNAALKVTTDPKQLLPTAGAFFKFHGGLQVMCVTVGGATIYAVGSADLILAADTSPLISLTMKFGFGAQIGVGLPVIGNVSILFMVGVEIYADSSQKIIVTAFMLFRGHAELLGGLVGVTITIEAKGSVEKGGPGTPTNCKAQVTFALDISIFLVIDISFSESWEETRQIA